MYNRQNEFCLLIMSTVFLMLTPEVKQNFLMLYITKYKIKNN